MSLKPSPLAVAFVYLFFGSILALFLWITYYGLETRIRKLEVIRSGVPFEQIDLGSRKPSRTTFLKLGNEKVKMLEYERTSSFSWGPDSLDILYIINERGWVIAASSLDLDSNFPAREIYESAEEYPPSNPNGKPVNP